jgi:hypothetical protein
MGRFLLGAVIGALAFFVYDRQIVGNGAVHAASTPAIDAGAVQLPERDDPPASPRFQCDGRTHCSQMTSCDEARFFLRNCPGVEMDGDNDGMPCERQCEGR